MWPVRSLSPSAELLVPHGVEIHCVLQWRPQPQADAVPAPSPASSPTLVGCTGFCSDLDSWRVLSGIYGHRPWSLFYSVQSILARLPGLALGCLLSVEQHVRFRSTFHSGIIPQSVDATTSGRAMPCAWFDQ